MLYALLAPKGLRRKLIHNIRARKMHLIFVTQSVFHSPSYTRIHYVDQTDLQHRDQPLPSEC